MIPAIGQRWKYLSPRYNILLEIVSLKPFSVEIVQSSPYSIDRGYTIGNRYSWNVAQDNDFSYCPGQDKPYKSNLI